MDLLPEDVHVVDDIDTSDPLDDRLGNIHVDGCKYGCYIVMDTGSESQWCFYMII